MIRKEEEEEDGEIGVRENSSGAFSPFVWWMSNERSVYECDHFVLYKGILQK